MLQSNEGSGVGLKPFRRIWVQRTRKVKGPLLLRKEQSSLDYLQVRESTGTKKDDLTRLLEAT